MKKKEDDVRTLILIETAEELIEFARLSRPQDDQNPYMSPADVTLILDNHVPALQGDECDFRLAGNVTEENIICAMAKECNISIYLT